MTTKTKIPSDAMQFASPIPVEFGEGEDGKNVKLTVYDGGVTLNNPFWGNLAFELSGLSFEKTKIPILYMHDPQQRVGFSTEHINKGKVVVIGKFLENNPTADQIRSDASQGFPFEASLRFHLESSKFTTVAEGEQLEVNGKMLKGPGTVFKKACIREVSITPLGAMRNTKTETYALNDSEKETAMDLTKLKADFADLYQQVFDLGRAEADKSGRDALSAIRKVCPDAELAVTAWENKQTPEQAQIAFLQKENADLKAKAEFAAKNPPVAAVTPLPAKPAVDPAKQEFMDGKPTQPLAPAEAQNFAAMTAEQFKEAHEKLWDTQPKVREGFAEKADYVAFKTAEREGRVG